MLRRKGEFDKAEQVYERILQTNAQEAEAYWGLILCKYGIEYVEDPVSGKRVPTCHRTSFDAITADEDYQSALFYAAISLEDKLGQGYEPYIFAALNSAKVMLVLGTKTQYFDAVWVKNEWSRFLKLMKLNRNKMLIPCYRDMDAYELPEEFAHLQAQDMSKIGFINDVIRGIRKILKSGNQNATEGVWQVSKESLYIDTVNIVKLGVMDYNAGDQEHAKEQFRKALERNPGCITAYIGLSLLKNVSTQEKNTYMDYVLQHAPQMTKEEKELFFEKNYIEYFCLFLEYLCENRLARVLEYHNCMEEIVIVDGMKITPLGYAVLKVKNVKALEFLLKNGADPNRIERIVDKNGVPCKSHLLNIAVLANSVEKAKLLIEAGAEVNQAFRTYGNGEEMSALSDAISEAEDVGITKVLLEAGADPNRIENVKDTEGNRIIGTMLTWAIIGKSQKKVDLLLRYGAGASWDKKIKLLNITKTNRKYPFEKEFNFSYEFQKFLRSKGWKGSLF